MDYIQLFFWGSAIIAIGFLANLLMEKKKIPDPLPLILMGILLKVIYPDVSISSLSNFAIVLTHLALLVIMFEAGLNLNLYSIIKTVNRAFVTSFLYFLLSAATTSILLNILLGLNPVLSVLIGTTLGGVSGPVAIPIINELIKDERKKSILFLDSIFSDIFVVIISLTLLEINLLGPESVLEAFRGVISKLAIGTFLGMIAGMLWIKVLRAIRSEKYNYMVTFAFLLSLYAVTELLGGSGAFASLVVGIVLSNAKEILEMLKIGYTYRLKGIVVYLHEEITFFIRTFFFVFLGMSIVLQKINFYLFLIAILISLFLILFRYLILSMLIGRDFETEVASLIAGRGLGAAVVSIIISKTFNNYLILTIVALVILLTNFVPEFLIFYLERKATHE